MKKSITGNNWREREREERGEGGERGEGEGEKGIKEILS